MDSTRLIEALQSPAAYRHSVDEIRLLETHISWILLTGSLAYKIKKPVDMGFLDFTTLPRRKFYCEEELRLNRRLAPELYLGVVPITGSEQSPRMDGEGEPIEYAVQMRQFPQEALLSQVLARQELTPAHVDALARLVAEFHGRVAIAPADGPFGTLQSLRQAMEELFDHLELKSEYQPAVERLRTWCRKELTARREQFANRRRDGFIRECHGDMHLGNMLLWDDRPVLFDCLEFNEDFRFSDVLSEVAFTTMDLEDRGNAVFSRRFLNAYLEQTGDYAGVCVLRYYLVYRALVRAKVASLRVRQAGLVADERRRVMSEHNSYLELAQRCARPPHPLLIITRGPSGSGKTTLTQPLLEGLGAIRIRSDIERKRLFALKPLDRSQARLGEGIYSAQATQRTFARLADLAGEVLRGGFPVIVDATFLKGQRRAAFRHLAQQCHVPFVILDFQASADVLRQRIVRRAEQAADASEADLTVLASQLQSSEPLNSDELACTIAVDSQQPDVATSVLPKLQELARAQSEPIGVE
jgi:aminoglycoside phosphotransferase family enzyme/predicted kinase